jgi:hypothetical protein
MRVSSQIQAARICNPLTSASRPRSVHPAGLEEVFRGMSTPAERLELPRGAITYSTGDLKQTAQRQ